MKTWVVLLGLLLLTAPLEAEGKTNKWKKAWKVSLGLVAASQAVDTASSWGYYELNPLLGRGQFGRRQVTIKISIASAVMLSQYLLVRKSKNAEVFYKPFSVANIGVSAVTGAVAYRNFRLK